MKKIFNSVLVLLLLFVLVACNNNEDTPYEYNNDIYYSLFVRSFADSNGDGIGDLNGVTENLDYLEELGVTGVWLLPIFESPSYHGYDVTNYYEINADYGTMDDLQNLLDEANKRDIDIILDFIFNHTSDQHPWYKDSTKRDWYEGHASFGGGMQDLNLNNSEVVDEIYNIAEFYLEMGVKGFRLDAVKHFFGKVPVLNHTENKMFMLNFERHLRSVKEDVFIVSEVYENDHNMINQYLISGGSYFNFYIQNQLQSKIADGINRHTLSTSIARGYDTYYETNPSYIDSPFISNHDMDRAIDMYRDEESLRQAMQILMTLPGNPFIYYGDELGMKGSRVEGVTIDGYDAPVYDEYRRQPFLWGDESKTTTWFPNHGTNDTPTYLEQKDDENSLFNFTKELITLRKENPALMDGLEIYNYRDLDNAQSYIRVINNDNVKQALLVIHNVRNENIEIDLDLEVVYGSKTLKPKSMVILEIPFNKLDDYR